MWPSGQTYEALTAVYVGHPADVTDLYVGRIGGTVSLGGVMTGHQDRGGYAVVDVSCF